jgi:hypothetical protein
MGLGGPSDSLASQKGKWVWRWKNISAPPYARGPLERSRRKDRRARRMTEELDLNTPMPGTL